MQGTGGFLSHAWCTGNAYGQQYRAGRQRGQQDEEAGGDLPDQEDTVPARAPPRLPLPSSPRFNDTSVWQTGKKKKQKLEVRLGKKGKAETFDCGKQAEEVAGAIKQATFAVASWLKMQDK